MKVTVYNSKGGVGKTRISINLALSLGCAIITNDINTLTLESVLDQNKYLKLTKDQPLDVLPERYDIVFDFGGFIDTRVTTAIKQSDWVLIPTLPEKDELQATINIITEVERVNQNIIVIANRTEGKKDMPFVERGIGKFFNYRVFEIKKSKAMPNITEYKKSIRAMVGEGGLKAYSYKKIANQFEEIIEHIS